MLLDKKNADYFMDYLFEYVPEQRKANLPWCASTYQQANKNTKIMVQHLEDNLKRVTEGKNEIKR